MSADPPRGPHADPDRRPGPVVRKDADGQRSIGRTWESVTERIIREAQARGEFDDLPAHRRPFRVEENPCAGDLALAFHLLRDAGVVADHDAAVRRLDSEAPSGCDHRPLIGHDAPLAALDQAIRGDRPGRAADPQDAPDAVA